MSVTGACRILGVYWELIPLPIIKSLMIKIASNLAFDNRCVHFFCSLIVASRTELHGWMLLKHSSSHVRAAVFRGLAFVLDNHLSHPLLKIVLTQLAPLLHDRIVSTYNLSLLFFRSDLYLIFGMMFKQEKVRSSFIDMLFVVKRIRSIRFYDIVKVDDLLAR